MEWLDWHNCYDDNWNGLIVPKAFSHPAKMARGLLSRIIKHGFQKGYWKKGDLIGDCFGGIGSTGILCASAGLRCVSVELERNFYDLALENYALHADVWNRCGDPLPVILNGDSRKFSELVGSTAGMRSSPPYASNEKSDYLLTEDGKTRQRDERRGFKQGGGCFRGSENYGDTDGQVGRLREGSLDAALTSPPYADGGQGFGSDLHPERATGMKTSKASAEAANNFRGGYGATNGQIGSLKEGEITAAISSPPWENQEPSHGQGRQFKPDHDTTRRLIDSEYGETEGQIGNATGETYWQAMKVIYGQLHQSLKTGGVACIVIKDYVKNKKQVPLCDQTCTLMEHVGFTVETRVRAWLVKEQNGTDLFGDAWSEKKERKSFFRRLAEKKGSPKIDWEEVIIARKMA